MADDKKASRTARKSALSREINKINRYIAEDNIDEVRNGIEKVKEKFASFENVHLEYLELIKENAEECDIAETYFDEAQGRYVDALLKIKQWVASQTAPKDTKPPSGSADSTHAELLSFINLPKVELEPYDGNPLHFHNFFAVFDEHVDNQRQEPAVKLTRLLQYTTGPAKEAIRNCALVGGAQGYKQARDILVRRFGDNHLIFDKVVKTVRFGKPARSNQDLLVLADEIANCKAVLKRMERLSEIDNQIFIIDIVNRLPNYLKNRWKRHALDFKETHDKYPALDEFEKFVNKEASGANDPIYGSIGSTLKPNSADKYSSSSFSTQVGMRNSSSGMSSRTWSCKACGENHRLFSCQAFKDMKPTERLKFVKDNKLCENCLLSNHQVSDCRKLSTCSVPGCGQRHTKYIHVDHNHRHRNYQTAPTAGNTNSVNAMNANVHASSNANTCVSVPLVAVNVDNQIGTLALLDCASTNTFCTRRLVNALGLTGSVVQYSLSTLNRSNVSKQTELVDLNLVSIDGAEGIKLSCVYVIDDIPVKVPNVDLSEFPHLVDLPFIKNKSCVDILIGQDHSEALIPLESRRGPPGDPFAVKTLLGWSLNGPTPVSAPVSKTVVSHFITTSNVEDDVQKLWSIENDGWLEEKSWSVEDRKVVQLWDKQAQFCDGHYVLPIPFKKNCVFPNNLSVSVSRLKSLKISLDRKKLFDQYNAEIQKLLISGHAERVPLFDISRSSNVWYLPHHAVTSPNKPDKLRVVFDCASRYAGESLNDKCLQGPDFNNKLLHVLLRFRLFEFAVMADVEKMYYQVRVPEWDRNYLRFLWFNDLGDVDYFRMTSHVFGGIWSGSAATYALRRTIDDFHASELVSDVIQHSFYVDDCLCSFASRDEAKVAIDGTRSLLHDGGFNLTKVITNDEELLLHVPESDRAVEVKGFDQDCGSKALGVKWNPVLDFMYFDVTLPGQTKVTRRSILQIVSSVFDPLGFLSPVLISGKMIFQEVTRLKHSWDDEISGEVVKRWHKWVSSLDSLKDIEIPRCVIPREFSDGHFEMHHFCDASERAYGVCSYLRSVNKDGKIHVAFLGGKGKVTPIKSLTIPRLELQAAVLAVRMDAVYRNELHLLLGKSTFWSDSTVVLQYIENETQRFNVFVGNRVGEIRRETSPAQWRHISGCTNPADLVSRGVSPECLKSSEWFSGPGILLKHKSDWDNPIPIAPLHSNDPEVKSRGVVESVSVVSCASEISELHPVDALIQHYSSWNGLKRAVGWWMKFMNLLKSKKVSSSCLSVTDVRVAEIVIIKRVQSLCFKNELRDLKQSNPVGKSSAIRDLSPILNSDGVLCVGGRLRHADLDVGNIHPVIIPHDHPIAELIVRELHNRAHLGVEWTLSVLREKYWLTKARVVIKRIKFKCVSCRKLYGSPCVQRMADIPPERLTPDKPPFSFIGIDCFGPFLVKLRRSNVKRYGCIFTCFTTRAIHIEKLDGLDTESYLNAFRRFVSRRGQPEKVWSDNGTNFVGARAELSKGLKEMDVEKIRKYGSDLDMEWHFNPPHASHWGGIYERAIRTIRRVLKGIMVDARLTDDILSTLFAEVESIVNGRPITKVSDQCDEPVALTPNHLLLLRQGPVAPPGVFDKSSMYRRRWKYVQHLAELFWKRWRKEYVPELIRRHKWFDKSRNLKVGDIVLMVDENTPRGLWPLAIVTDAIAGRDNLVRSVRVKTKSSELLRPVTKVVFIEGE